MKLLLANLRLYRTTTLRESLGLNIVYISKEAHVFTVTGMVYYERPIVMYLADDILYIREYLENVRRYRIWVEGLK